MSQQYPPPQWQPSQPPYTSYPSQGEYWTSPPQQPSYTHSGDYYSISSVPPSQPQSHRSFWVATVFITCLLVMGVIVAVISRISATTEPASWATTQTFSGNGMENTQVFSVSNHWKLNWSCDPSSFAASYNVIVDVYSSDNTLLAVAINTLCSDNNTSGSTEEYQGGMIYLSIDSEAAWTLQIQEPQ